MITPFEAKEWVDYPYLSVRQRKIVEMRADVMDDDHICEKLHITRAVLEATEEEILELMDVSF